MASPRKAAIVQSLRRPATLCTKLEMSFAPSGVCTTSGWNMVVKMRRFSSVAMANGAFSLVAFTVKPSGSFVTRSPWLIHTG